MDAELREQFEETWQLMTDALAAARELARLARRKRAGENGMAGDRLEAYLIPTLEEFIEDNRQIGSLASFEEDVEYNDEEEEEDE